MENETEKMKLNKKSKELMKEDPILGKMVKDIITGVKGIVVGKLVYLFGCNQYGISPGLDKDGKPHNTIYIDEGRIVVIGKGVEPEEVRGKKPGPDFNHDAPTGRI